MGSQPNDEIIENLEASGIQWPTIERPHQVTLTKGFFISVNLVTQEEWEGTMGTNPSTKRFIGF